MQIKDKVAVVTGAGSGIGRALVLALAKDCRALAICDKNGEALGETVRLAGPEMPILSVEVDVADREQVEAFSARTLAEYGSVDIVINNAGVTMGRVHVEDLSYEDFEWVMKVNFWGMVYGTQAFLPHLMAQPQAAIVNVSSLFGLVGVAFQIPYCASKFAIRGFSESLRMEAKVRFPHVQVMSVHPGGIKTAIASNARQRGHLSAEQHRKDSEEFEKMFINTAEMAAGRILKGIRRGKGRVVIGRDAHFVSFLQRLMPSAYISLIGRQVKKRLAKRDQSFAQERRP